MYHNQLVIKGKIILETPMHIGSGESGKFGDDEGQIQLIVKDKDGLPYIPASTLKGVLRQICPTGLQAELFGCAKEKDNGNIGAIYFSNCFIDKRDSYASLLENQPRSYKDGKPIYISSRTKINRKTGVADQGDGEGGKLFNFEMVPAGVEFNFEWRVLNATEACKGNITQFLSLISDKRGFNLGNSTSSGHGLCKIPEDMIEIGSISASGQQKPEAFNRLPADQIDNLYYEKWTCHYELKLDGIGPFLSINHDVERQSKSSDPQIVPMKDQSGNPLLLPTSVKGVLRKRAAWIDQQICQGKSDDFDKKKSNDYNDYKAKDITKLTPTQRLFGVTGWRGLLEIEAVECLEKGTELDHTSVAIDRFTGGSLCNALFKTRCFVKPSFLVKLKLRETVAEDEEFSFPNEADRKLLSALIADMEENGLQLGHGISKGFGWFDITIITGERGTGLEDYFTGKTIESPVCRDSGEISDDDKNRIITQIKNSPDKAPYNFVHIENEIVSAPSGNGDCHDIDMPEEGRVSGVLDMRYIVETPLLIGSNIKSNNGHIQSVRLGINKDDYALPGSSLKGMIRSIYEIATFSGIGFMNEDSLTYRDMSGGSEYLKIIDDAKNDFHGGWLKKENKEWKITEADWYRIDLKELESKTNCSEESWRKKTVEEKYTLLNSKIINGTKLTDDAYFQLLTPRVVKRKCKKSGRTYDAVQKLSFSEGNHPAAKQGEIICSGKIPKLGHGKKSNKQTESIFFKKDDAESYKVDQKVMDRFFVAYGEPGTNGEEPGEYLKYWLKKHSQSLTDNDIPPIPVFFKGTGNDIKEIGMTRLMKIAYKHSLESYLPYPQNKTRDFTQSVFGYVNKEGDSKEAKTEALASRIQFGWAVLQNNKDLNDTKQCTTVAMSPRPTFWPYYLKHKTRSTKRKPAQCDYNSSPGQITLAGRKRYPIHGKAKELPSSLSENVTSKLEFIRTQQDKPLRFEGQIRFHNLHPVEFGALIWAITLGRSPHLRHSLGHSKAYGYGQLKADILSAKLSSSKSTDLQDATLDSYVDKFEHYMEENTGDNWRQSESIQSLLNMTNPDIGKEISNELTYLKDHNEYGAVKAKSQGRGLPEFV